ncbi:photosystem II reaction center protein PsbN [Gloeobacter violaceus]|uniref:Protein PsbN n=1 Tax=Gloeobacter violaceus (strain ATCC 29082 / PCC 7421) TaxID=251221 RepID=PSBN_GLOVI|nr:photosystem II reaction center protein PsbN [Gloeobacter violaceus]Q7NCH8.1 RecName: Full=Protein PsbN [Gloeobacter violaceus PCC 7421]BAC90942.1 photosystem II protein [Gloeobacter violaceus PCC 7421]
MTVAQVFVVGILVALVLITAFAVYTAFGPPSKKLADPFEMHED